MLGIKIMTALKSELNRLHENVQNVDPRCLGSREMHKTKKGTNIVGQPVVTASVQNQLTRFTQTFFVV